jgi:uncharacterized membrane protein YraQ (UPF0718 family)
MMLAGMGVAPALALLITLPAVSVPSLIMLRKAFPAKALWLTGWWRCAGRLSVRWRWCSLP